MGALRADTVWENDDKFTDKWELEVVAVIVPGRQQGRGNLQQNTLSSDTSLCSPALCTTRLCCYSFKFVEGKTRFNMDINDVRV